jgi:toxin CcdB
MWAISSAIIGEAPKSAARLNPIFNVNSERLVMVTRFAASVPVRQLGDTVQSLSGDDAISAALDLLIVGFCAGGTPSESTISVNR